MFTALTLSDEEDLDSGTLPDPVLVQAEAALEQGRPSDAANLCLKAVSARRLAVLTAANIVLILRRAGAPEAGMIEEDLLDQLRARAARIPDDPLPQIRLGRLLCGFERFDEAGAVLSPALARRPLDPQGVRTMTAILLRQGRPDDVVAFWRPVFEADPLNGALPLELARILADGGFLDLARSLLDRAEPLCKENRYEFEFVAAAIRGTGQATSQAAMTVELFDRLAGSYDESLVSLGNRGPQMVGQVLAGLPLQKTRRQTILDAGCGTGLCAPLLRPYAKTLHGVDLSTGMLTKAKKKNLYHRLTCSDLASLGTLPAGPFDMIVSSDVLVYFGDLALVLGNLSALLRPGGWLILTLEQTERPGGWFLGPSGRHKHDPDYVRAALQSAGFTAPKVRIDGHLRHEFGRPVNGFAVAAQRLALAFGPPPR